MIGTVDHFYTQTCGRCKTSNILVDRRAGDVTCLSCGRVLQSRILDNGDETLSYDDDKGGKLSRTSGMTDPILGSSETVYAGSTKAARKQLERVQKSIADRSEKNILRFIPNINEICANLHLPGTVKETAVKLFVDVMMKKILVINKLAISATCIYLACRIMQCPRVLEEIALGTNIESSLIQRMQGDILKGMQLAIRITKSVDIFMRFAQRCLERLSAMQFSYRNIAVSPTKTNEPVNADTRLSIANPQKKDHIMYRYQMTLRLPYLCLEEGISLCERISEYELLPENCSPQSIVAAVLVWLLLLVSDVNLKSLSEENSFVRVGSAENVSPEKLEHPSTEELLSQTLWPPLLVESIAEDCYTTGAAVKNVILRLFASMKVLLLLPASGAEGSAESKTSVVGEQSQKTKSMNPPAEIHQRFALAFERFQEALAVQSAAIATSPNVTSPGTGKKRKRSLSSGQSAHAAGVYSSSSGGSELALTLDRLLSGEGEDHFIRSPIWKDSMQLNQVSASPSLPTSRVNSSGKLTTESNVEIQMPHASSETPPDAAPVSDSLSRQQEIQQLSQGLFMSQRKRFKTMIYGIKS